MAAILMLSLHIMPLYLPQPLCTEFNADNLTVTLDTTISSNEATYLLPVGVTTGVVVILAAAITTGAFVLAKVYIKKRQHIYEDMTGGECLHHGRIAV